MITIREALRSIADSSRPLSRERVRIEAARDRFVGGEICARLDVPPFDNSAMDGWAVRAEDVAAAPVTLPIVGESRAGSVPGTHRPGSAMRIFTGAPLPEGADAVVMQENATRTENTVQIERFDPSRRHIRHRAEVFAQGMSLFSPGARLGAGAIGILASQSIALVEVHRRPRVAILSTGDELRELGDPPRPGSIVDSNAYALAAAVEAAGGIAMNLPSSADDADALSARFRAALDVSDIVVTTGGVSVGDYDLVASAMRTAGVEQRFHRVAIKPGKPVWFGVRDGTLAFGLPGNPLGAWVTFEVFVRPAIRTMLGERTPHRASIDVELATPTRVAISRTELLRARLEERPGAIPLAHLDDDQGSAAIRTLTADALVIATRDEPRIDAGTRLRALDLATRRGTAAHAYD